MSDRKGVLIERADKALKVTAWFPVVVKSTSLDSNATFEYACKPYRLRLIENYF